MHIQQLQGRIEVGGGEGLGKNAPLLLFARAMSHRVTTLLVLEDVVQKTYVDALRALEVAEVLAVALGDRTYSLCVVDHVLDPKAHPQQRFKQDLSEGHVDTGAP